MINCKDALLKEGFKSGIFHTDNHSTVFVASDALAHYILMMYKVAHREQFSQELDIAESNHTKNENYIKTAKAMQKIDFEKDVLNKLFRCIGNQTNFQRHIKSLIRKGLIAYDDYSLAMMTFDFT